MALYREASLQLSGLGVAPERLDRLFGRPRVLPDSVLYTRLDEVEAALVTGPIEFRAWTPNYPGAQLPSANVASADPPRPTSALIEFTMAPMPAIELQNNRRFIKLGFGLSNIEVIQTIPSDIILDDEMRYQISLLQLRPALKNSSPVDMGKFQLHYHFAPQQNLSTNEEG